MSLENVVNQCAQEPVSLESGATRVEPKLSVHFRADVINPGTAEGKPDFAIVQLLDLSLVKHCIEECLTIDSADDALLDTELEPLQVQRFENCVLFVVLSDRLQQHLGVQSTEDGTVGKCFVVKEGDVEHCEFSRALVGPVQHDKVEVNDGQREVE